MADKLVHRYTYMYIKTTIHLLHLNSKHGPRLDRPYHSARLKLRDVSHLRRVRSDTCAREIVGLYCICKCIIEYFSLFFTFLLLNMILCWTNVCGCWVIRRVILENCCVYLNFYEKQCFLRLRYILEHT